MPVLCWASLKTVHIFELWQLANIFRITANVQLHRCQSHRPHTSAFICSVRAAAANWRFLAVSNSKTFFDLLQLCDWANIPTDAAKNFWKVGM